jgi:diaminohydroxyphosphoribosylaminopyrimidine deaminase / 5-amino-6-(5-phosphoribosylamino)uracil reductase
MNDETFMRRALELAGNGRYTVSPNPMVGCVIVRDGAVIGEGWHRRAGEAHAEVEALRGCDARGATMYVTLEPCCHHGRTGPCADAVVASGAARVVIATLDPNERVDGRGATKLRDVGIDVTVGVLEAEARRLNEKFLWSITHRLPFVLLKAGMTLDGKLATVARDAQWITSEASRERSLALREEYDAILVGSGTVKSDNPRLTRRLGLAGESTPWTRVVLDGESGIPPHAQLLTDGGRTILFTSNPDRYSESEGLEIVSAPGDLQQVLAELHARGIRSLLVEGGAAVHSEMIRRGLWQKMILFLAPMFVGGAEAPAILGNQGVQRLTDAYRVRFDRTEGVGDDLMIVAYPA